VILVYTANNFFIYVIIVSNIIVMQVEKKWTLTA